jgi:hypothetical protein
MSTIARKLETELVASVAQTLPGWGVYRHSENGVRQMPFAVISVRVTGTDYMAKSAGGTPAAAVEVRATVVVDAGAQSGADSLEAGLATVRNAIETATLQPGWTFVHLEFAGDEEELSDTARASTLIWNGVAI